MKQIFFEGGINRDSTPKFIGDNYFDAQNIIFQVGKDGKGGLLRMYSGFDRVGAEEDLGQTYGDIEDKANSKVYYFLTDSIWVYDQLNETRTKIFEWDGLGEFKKHGAIIENFLFWVDGINQPRYINVTRDYQSVIEEDITIIRPAPLFPLIIERNESESTYSALRGFAFQFSYRYVYEDNQTSVLAPFTESIYGDELLESIFVREDVREDIPKYVRDIQLLVRRNDWDFWQIWETISPEDFRSNVYIDYNIVRDSQTNILSLTIITLNGQNATDFNDISNESIKTEAGNQVFVSHRMLELVAPEDDPQIYIDVYRNGELWERQVADIVTGLEQLSFSFQTQPNFYYQIYTYSVTDGEPLENPFGGDIIGFQYKGNTLGRAIPRNESVKLFENVPLSSKSLEVARDRVFLANNTEGYDRYQVPSLRATVTTDTQDLGTVNMEVWVQRRVLNEEEYTTAIGGYFFAEEEFVYYLRNGDNFYFFKLGSRTRNGSPGGPNDFRPSDYTGDETNAIIDPNNFSTMNDLNFSREEGFQGEGQYWLLEISEVTKVSPDHIVTTNLEEPNVTGITKFKNRSQYRIGIVFYDRYLRNQGVYTNQNCIATINDDFRSGEVSLIRWDLSGNSNIPIWADTYQIVRTDNLSKTTFLQGLTSDVYWVYIESDELKYSRSFRPDAEFIEIDLSGSLKAGIAYNLTQGDLIDIETNTETFTYSIVGFIGSKIRIQSINNVNFENTTSPVRLFYEIYTPKLVAEDLIFYEVSQVFPILNKRTIDRSFSVLSGFLRGDVTVVESDSFEYPDVRTITDGEFNTNDLETDPITIIVEARNPDLNFNVGWIKDLGRANAVVDFDQVNKKGAIRFSNRFIQGTRVNGISNFDAFDEEVIGIENGQVNRIVLVSKEREQGTIILALCEQEALSLYLGETQFVDNEGQQIVGSSSKVIGTINPLAGGNGLKHTNAVVVHEGRAWWWNAYNFSVCRYDPNGVRPISEIGMKSHFYGRNTEPLVGYDPFHKLLLIKFDEVLSFDENFNQWRSFYQFIPDWFGKINDFLVSFKNGIPYRSNANSVANYFGVQNNGIFTFKLIFSSPQILDNIGLYLTSDAFEWQGNIQVLKDVIDIVITNDKGQETNLINTDFEVNEDVAYAHILRDINSQGGLMLGNEMRDDIFTVKITIKENIGIETIIFNENRSSGHI